MLGSDLIGQILEDRYRIRRLLGRGGMGAVYEADAIRLGRRCAVKVLLPEFTGSELAVQRFRREAQVAARVKHPNVVEIFDTGTTGDGSGYIAMELLEGESLDRTLKREGRLPWARVRHITLQICRALAAAHAQRIVHRDMKPENCFRVRRDGDDDTIKVLDFGIAKLTDADPSADTPRLTATNSVVGTYAYMAFELVSGQDCDHRVDVWAVGVMMYEMLTGVLPFRGNNQGQIWSAIFQHEPPPLSHQAPGAAIPEAVEGIVRKALAKDRHARFSDADALARAIQAVPGDAAPVEFESSPARRVVQSSAVDVAAVTLDGFALVAPPARRRNPATVGIDPQALTVATSDDVAEIEEDRRTEQVIRLAAPTERAATVVAEQIAIATAVPPRPRLLRRALLLAGLGVPALALMFALLMREPGLVPAPPAASDPVPVPVVPAVAPSRPEPTAPPDDRSEPVVPLPSPPLEPALVPPPTAPKSPLKASKAPPRPMPKKTAPASTYARRIDAELRRAQERVTSACAKTQVEISVDVEISATTGHVTKAQTRGLARGSAFARCAERELRAWLFPRGESSDTNIATAVTFPAG